MSVGENIRELRRREQLSQMELAEALGVSKETVSRWENDRMAVRQRHITRLCELFSVSPDDISSEGMGLSSRAMIRRGGTRDVTMAMPGLFPAYRIVEGPSGSSLKPLDPVFAPMDVAEKHAESIFLRTNDAGVSRTIPKDSFVLVDPSASPWNGCIVAAVVDGTRMLIRRYSTGNSMVMLSANSYEPTMGDDLVLDRRRVKILGTCVWLQATLDLTT